MSKEVYLQIAGKTEEEALAELRPQAATELRREAVVAAIAAAEGITVVRRRPARPRGPRAGRGRGRRRGGRTAAAEPRHAREQVLRERVLELLAREAVGISIEDAQASGKPWPQEHAPELAGAAEPEEPPQSGAASAEGLADRRPLIRRITSIRERDLGRTEL